MKIRECLMIDGLCIFDRPVEYDIQQISWLKKYCTNYIHYKETNNIYIEIAHDKATKYVIVITND